MKNRTVDIIKLLLGLVIIVFLLLKFDLYEVGKTIISVPFTFFIITLLVYTLVNIIGTYKIWILFLGFAKKLNFVKLFKDYSLSWGLGLFVPGKIGEFSLVYFLKRKGIDLGLSSALVLFDKISAFVVLSLAAVTGFVLYASEADTIMLMGALLIIYVVIFFFVFSDFGRGLIKKFIFKSKSEKFKGFSKSLFYLIRKKKLVIVFALLLGALKWLVNSALVFILLRYFGQPVGFLSVFFITSAVTIVSFIPITFNGIGLKESGAIVLFSLFGIKESAVLATFLYLFIMAVILGLIHILYSFKEIKAIKF